MKHSHARQMREFADNGVTVNGLMGWLNSLFGLKVPVLPLSGFSQYLKNLWNRLIIGNLPDPQDPQPWVITVEGNFDGLFPEESTIEVQASILVGKMTWGSPDVPVGAGGEQD